jgi:hypothetical protein
MGAGAVPIHHWVVRTDSTLVDCVGSPPSLVTAGTKHVTTRLKSPASLAGFRHRQSLGHLGHLTYQVNLTRQNISDMAWDPRGSTKMLTRPKEVLSLLPTYSTLSKRGKHDLTALIHSHTRGTPLYRISRIPTLPAYDIHHISP